MEYSVDLSGIYDYRMVIIWATDSDDNVYRVSSNANRRRIDLKLAYVTN